MKIHNYDTQNYKFREILQKVYMKVNFQGEDKSIDRLPPVDPNLVKRENDQKTFYHEMYYNSEHHAEFVAEYKRFIQNEILKNYPDEEFVVVQKEPTFRVHNINNVSVGILDSDRQNMIGLHKDSDFGHPEQEENYLVCMTKMFDSNSVHVETSIGSDEYAPITMEYGQYCTFDGNHLRHFNKVNLTGVTRISFDFRVIPFSKYREDVMSKITSITKGKKYVVNDYYELYCVNKNISVVGIGRLGLCTALVFEKAGFNVMGVDVSESYIKAISQKTLKSNEPYVEEYLTNATNFEATTDLKKALNHSNTIFIVVPTPNSGEDDVYDTKYLTDLLVNINKLKVVNKRLIICCTVMPGFIDNVGTYILRDCVNTTLSYNPEFIRQGNIIKDYESPDMVLIGEGDKNSGYVVEYVIKKSCINKPVFCKMKPIEAEITKITLNGFLTMKISYANMMSDYCDALSRASGEVIDKSVVLNAVGSDTRVGTKFLRPGYSFGGPCLPRDTKALRNVLEKENINTDLIRASANYNDLHNNIMAKELMSKNLDKYIFDGVCYKEGSKVPIIEHSPKLAIAEILAKTGHIVVVRDCAEIVIEVIKKYGKMFEYEVV